MDLTMLKGLAADYSVKITLTLVILVGARFLIRWVAGSVENFMKKLEAHDAIATLLGDLAKFVLWILSIAAIFNVLGLKEISIALGGSIAVLGFGLARSVSDVAGDLLAGFFLIIDEDFDVGSQVDIGGIAGEVESLDIRKTKVRDETGNLHIIPNKQVDGKAFIIIPPAGQHNKTE